MIRILVPRLPPSVGVLGPRLPPSVGVLDHLQKLLRILKGPHIPYLLYLVLGLLVCLAWYHLSVVRWRRLRTPVNGRRDGTQRCRVTRVPLHKRDPLLHRQ